LARITISQTNIPILGSTVVDCFAWVHADGSTIENVVVQVLLDGQLCGSASGVTTDYVRVGGQIAVVGDVHTITVVVTRLTGRALPIPFTVAVDDVSLIPVSGLGAVGGCPPTTVTAPPLPGET
jgi:hypothetical protein